MKSPHADRPDTASEAALRSALAGFFDAKWYIARYPDVAASGIDPLRHFILHGAAEQRDPNRWFDSAWYAEHYPDVGSAAVNPLLHYLQSGAGELRNPHPRFDAVWYVDQHPEAAANPLLYHLRYGHAQGWLTEKSIAVADYLPSTTAPHRLPRHVAVDVVIPVYRGLEETQCCINSVLADRNRPPGRVIVVDDHSPEQALSAWLDELAATGRIDLVRNRRNLGFVVSVNRGIEAAGEHDVALLNSDTEVPSGWLRRLAAQAYAAPRIASVSPFSNNATICGYPSKEAGPIPFGLSLTDADDLCRSVNAGRSVEVPTTVGFCMYIRRAALDEVGAFDAETFGQGYGEENDFCMRAAEHGWRHRLACDTFVYHKGSVSFAGRAATLAARGLKLVSQRYPHYTRIVAVHVTLDAVGPYRLALTVAAFRQSGLPTILMVCHELGGGVRRHITLLAERLAGRANCLVLEATARGAALTVPTIPGHAQLILPKERLNDLLRVLRAANVSRVHIHHLFGMDVDIRALIGRLDVPFDVTVHDYYAICPQVNLLPWADSRYCGEPGPAGCNACIADRPSHGARDILSWRREQTWQYFEADRVICPSNDLRDRLDRYGLAARAIVAPHEPVAPGPWRVTAPSLRGSKLRVAVLGVLANHKGAHAVSALAEAADPAQLEIHLIGYTEDDFPAAAAHRIHATGEYQDADLPRLLAELRPHVVWFPAPWPETYSYTLSAALVAGLPIVATRIGAFQERLAGRPLTWLADSSAATADWLATFDTVRSALRVGRAPVAGKRPPAGPDFYASAYLAPPETPVPRSPHARVDLRRPGRISVVVIPERLGGEVLSPCAYIRLLQPLDHPQIGGDMDIVLADAETALRYHADIIATQRYAIPDIAAADALGTHARQTGATLLYDLDDDLLHIPRNHPDAPELRPKAKVVQRMLRHADAVWVSTPALAASLAPLRTDAVVVPNGLDERLWAADPSPRRLRQGQVRILCMGTATHDDDFAMVEPALARLKHDFHERVAVDMLGVSSKRELPAWVNRLSMPVTATRSYPGFVNWIASQPGWDIGLAPLVDTPFNRCKSQIKTLDYGALEMAVLASAGDVYRGSLADGPGGMLVANDPAAWYAALSWLIRDPPRRRKLAQGALAAYSATGTLAGQSAVRRAAWVGLVPSGKRAKRRSAQAR